MSLPTDQVIARLTDELRPVRRLPSPAVRAAQWLGIVGGLAACLAIFAKFGAIEHRLGAVPDMWEATLGAALTAVLGAVATFQLSLPDRRTGWALLPLPGLALWIGASGLGCLRDWVIPDMHPATLRESGHCFTFIVGVSVPLSILILLMIRRAYPLRPNLTAITGGLSVAAASAALLTFFHPYDASAVDLLVHAVAVTTVIVANRVVGGWLLSSADTLRMR